MLKKKWGCKFSRLPIAFVWSCQFQSFLHCQHLFNPRPISCLSPRGLVCLQPLVNVVFSHMAAIKVKSYVHSLFSFSYEYAKYHFIKTLTLSKAPWPRLIFLFKHSFSSLQKAWITWFNKATTWGETPLRCFVLTVVSWLLFIASTVNNTIVFFSSSICEFADLISK